MKTALIVVDMQNDFITGSLAVPGAQEVVKGVREYIETGNYDLLVFTRDSHPFDHISFASRHKAEPFTTIELPGTRENPLASYNMPPVPHFEQDVWPDHCIIGTKGWEIHRTLKRFVTSKAILVDKGTNALRDAYSGFDGTNLLRLLQDQDITTVVVVGLAYDFCVKATALDAANEGFDVVVPRHLTASVFPDRDEETKRRLNDSGVTVT